MHERKMTYKKILLPLLLLFTEPFVATFHKNGFTPTSRLDFELFQVGTKV